MTTVLWNRRNTDQLPTTNRHQHTPTTSVFRRNFSFLPYTSTKGSALEVQNEGRIILLEFFSLVTLYTYSTIHTSQYKRAHEQTLSEEDKADA